MLVYLEVYTEKKGLPYSRPQPGCHWPNSLWTGIIYIWRHNSRPGRVWSVTSRLGTGKWLTFFTVYIYHHVQSCSVLSTLRLRRQIHTPYFYSTPICILWLGLPPSSPFHRELVMEKIFMVIGFHIRKNNEYIASINFPELAVHSSLYTSQHRKKYWDFQCRDYR